MPPCFWLSCSSLVSRASHPSICHSQYQCWGWPGYEPRVYHSYTLPRTTSHLQLAGQSNNWDVYIHSLLPLHTHSQPLLLLLLWLLICWHWALPPSWGDGCEPGLGWGVWWLQSLTCAGQCGGVAPAGLQRALQHHPGWRAAWWLQQHLWEGIPPGQDHLCCARILLWWVGCRWASLNSLNFTYSARNYPTVPYSSMLRWVTNDYVQSHTHAHVHTPTPTHMHTYTHTCTHSQSCTYTQFRCLFLGRGRRHTHHQWISSSLWRQCVCKRTDIISAVVPITCSKFHSGPVNVLSSVCMLC